MLSRCCLDGVYLDETDGACESQGDIQSGQSAVLDMSDDYAVDPVVKLGKFDSGSLQFQDHCTSAHACCNLLMKGTRAPRVRERLGVRGAGTVRFISLPRDIYRAGLGRVVIFHDALAHAIVHGILFLHRFSS